MKEIPLFGKFSNGHVALIDDGDYELVSSYRWYVWLRETAAGRPNGPYAYTHLTGAARRSSKFMHTLLTGWPMTDHINHDGLDNQRSNLRQVTPSQNNHNQRRRLVHSSRFKGVTWNRQIRKWQAQIKIGDRHLYLGSFADDVDAARAYDAAALEAFGEYACVNGVAA